MGPRTFQFHYDDGAKVLWVGETGQEYDHSEEILGGKIICDFNKEGQFTGLEIHNPKEGISMEILLPITFSGDDKPTLAE